VSSRSCAAFIVMRHGRVPMTKKMPSDVGNANSLCHGLERFKRLVGVNRTRSEAVQEPASHPHPRARSAAETRSAASYPRLPGESDDDYGAFWASRPPLPPKSMCGPVYCAPAKGKQLAYANAANTNQPHHCTAGFGEFVKPTRQLALVQFKETVPVPLCSRRAFA
jgi:hypothetical protein